MMKTANEILNDRIAEEMKYQTHPHFKNLDREDVVRCMIKYAEQFIDEIAKNPSKYGCSANGETAVIIWPSSIAELKQKLV